MWCFLWELALSNNFSKHPRQEMGSGREYYSEREREMQIT